MIISLALLGFGASGTFITLTQHWHTKHFHFSFTLNAVLFALTTVASFILAQNVPFNPLEIFWDHGQLFHLVKLYLILWVPFFSAANCIGLTLTQFKDQIHRIYRFDLLGAGTGALGMIGLLFAFTPITCLKLLGALAFFAAALVNCSRRTHSRYRWLPLAFCLCGMAMPFVWPSQWLDYRISEYKGLSYALRLPNAEVLSEHSSPLGWLTVADSPTIPFRHAPGLSLNCPLEPPPQLGVFTDGDSLSPINRYGGDRELLAYLDYLSPALPYHLLKSPTVLILGAGGGTDLLMARYHQAKSIDAVELNAQFVHLVKEIYADYAGHLYQRDEVKVHMSEARGFVAGSTKHFDLIQISLLDSFHTSVSGGHALSATYLYTVEALQDYYHHLHTGGLVAITRWLKMPPRDSLKLFATALTALEKSGVLRPERQLALIRSWKTTTLLMKNGEWTPDQIRTVENFCQERSFDVVYYPGIKPTEVNRYNVLEQPYFYQGIMALLSKKRGDFLERYKFTIIPATDDRPYFFYFFKWRTLKEVFSLAGQGGWSLLEWGYPILIVTTLQVAVISFVLIILPLWALQRKKNSLPNRTRIVFYFLFLGLAFLFVEITFMQKFALFLSHPLYAIAVVLCAFLVFAGLGSGYSRKVIHYFDKYGQRKEGVTIACVVSGIILIAFIYSAVLPFFFHRWMTLPELFKIPVSIAFIAPLAFLMGMPFPLGLSRVAAAAPDFIPWAWAVNGCASVLSALLATILAIHFGFTVVIGSALIFYGLAAVVLWQPLTGVQNMIPK
jgi:hypothetical protein